MNEDIHKNNTSNINSSTESRSFKYSDSDLSFFEFFEILKESKKLVFMAIFFGTLVSFSYVLNKTPSYHSSATIQLGEFYGSPVQTHNDIKNDIEFYFNNINLSFIGNTGLIISTSNRSKEKGESNLKNAVDFLIYTSNNLINNKLILKQSEIDLLKESKKQLGTRLSKINSLSKKDDFKSQIQAEEASNSLMMEMNEINFKIKMLEERMFYSPTSNSKVYSEVRTIEQSSSKPKWLIIGAIFGFIFGCTIAIFKEFLKRYSTSRLI
jgi:capsular polysaccharide biosynthesis protein